MAERKQKSPRNLERYFKGVSNHRRIQILFLIARHSDMSVIDIAEAVKGNMKTIADHVRRLTLAGLVEKKHAGAAVEHSLTPYGREFFDFINRFSSSQEHESKDK